jgi:predicted nucleic acid-binding protein
MRSLPKVIAMDDYNFLPDLLDTFQSSSDYIKTVIILTPPAFVLGVVHLLTRHRRHTTKSENADFVALTPIDNYIEQVDREPRLTHEQPER